MNTAEKAKRSGSDQPRLSVVEQADVDAQQAVLDAEAVLTEKLAACKTIEAQRKTIEAQLELALLEMKLSKDKLGEAEADLFSLKATATASRAAAAEKQQAAATLLQALVRRRLAARSTAASATVFFGGLPDFMASEKRVFGLMIGFGEVAGITMHKSDGGNKPWAFVTFETSAVAKYTVGACADLKLGFRGGPGAPVQVQAAGSQDIWAQKPVELAAHLAQVQQQDPDEDYGAAFGLSSSEDDTDEDEDDSDEEQRRLAARSAVAVQQQKAAAAAATTEAAAAAAAPAFSFSAAAAAAPAFSFTPASPGALLGSGAPPVFRFGAVTETVSLAATKTACPSTSSVFVFGSRAESVRQIGSTVGQDESEKLRWAAGSVYFEWLLAKAELGASLMDYGFTFADLPRLALVSKAMARVVSEDPHWERMVAILDATFPLPGGTLTEDSNVLTTTEQAWQAAGMLVDEQPSDEDAPELDQVPSLWRLMQDPRWGGLGGAPGERGEPESDFDESNHDYDSDSSADSDATHYYDSDSDESALSSREEYMELPAIQRCKKLVLFVQKTVAHIFTLDGEAHGGYCGIWKECPRLQYLRDEQPERYAIMVQVCTQCLYQGAYTRMDSYLEPLLESGAGEWERIN